MLSPEIKAKLGLNASEFEEKLRAASTKSRTFAREVSKDMKEAKSVVLDVAGEAGLGMIKKALIGGSVAAVAFGASLVESIKDGIKALDELDVTAKRIGDITISASPEKSQALGKEQAAWLDQQDGAGGDYKELAQGYIELLEATDGSESSVAKTKERFLLLQKMAIDTGIEFTTLAKTVRTAMEGGAESGEGMSKILRKLPGFSDFIKEQQGSAAAGLPNIRNENWHREGDEMIPDGPASARYHFDQIRRTSSALSADKSAIDERRDAAEHQAELEEERTTQLRDRAEDSSSYPSKGGNTSYNQQVEDQIRDQKEKDKLNRSYRERSAKLSRESAYNLSKIDRSETERVEAEVTTDSKGREKFKYPKDEHGTTIGLARGLTMEEYLAQAAKDDQAQEDVKGMSPMAFAKSGKVNMDTTDRFLQSRYGPGGQGENALENRKQTPEGQLADVMDGLEDIEKALASGLLPELQATMKEFLVALPKLTEEAKDLGTALGTATARLKEFLQDLTDPVGKSKILKAAETEAPKLDDFVLGNTARLFEGRTLHSYGQPVSGDAKKEDGEKIVAHLAAIKAAIDKNNADINTVFSGR